MGKVSKDKRDIYYRKAKELGFRARSAFKLIQLDEEFELFEGKTRVVDLCAAPGGWTQVISKRIYDRQRNLADESRMQTEQQHEENSDVPVGKIVAVDLMEMADIDGVIQIQGDITRQRTVDLIISEFDGQKAQVVVSDGAPDVLGMHDLDEYLQAQLVLAALNISLHLLEEGGTFVAKIFRGKDVSLLFSQLNTFFKKVSCAKPKASRNSSYEAFVVCEGFSLPSDFAGSMDQALVDFEYNTTTNAVVGPKNFTVPFRACGDVHGYDADQSYPVDEESGYVHREPLQKPINPPYAKCLKKRREQHMRRKPDVADPKKHPRVNSPTAPKSEAQDDIYM